MMESQKKKALYQILSSIWSFSKEKTEGKNNAGMRWEKEKEDVTTKCRRSVQLCIDIQEINLINYIL